MAKTIKNRSVIKCPICKYKKEEQMPSDSCQIMYECEECNARLHPKPGSCCVFCSYGSVPCPPVQEKNQGRV
jgi:hypothetical protein